MNLENLLKKYFGYSSFRPGQREVIDQVINGKDCIALLPTGRGKSLCYQFPGIVFKQSVLIISPLLSLMQDQVEQLKKLGEKRVIALNSFLNGKQKKAALQNLHRFRFIFISPEMLVQTQIQERIRKMKFSLIVVDEAHCISQWGFDFRPDYLRIGEIFEGSRPPILALSATATEKVILDIKTYLKMDEPFELIHSIDRPNIHFSRVFLQNKEEKFNWIVQHVIETEGPGIIYVSSRSKTEQLSQLLLQQHIAVASYHGGKDAEDRQFIQQQFLLGELEWIVATNAFGMGVHKNDIRQIIHETMPGNVANYMQEVGRAGRDGNDAVAILLYADGDEEITNFIAMEDVPEKEHIEKYKQYIEDNKQPFQMVEEGLISETKFRILHYWMDRETPEKVSEILDDMRKNKEKSVKEMAEIIKSNECIREKLLHYFGQELLKKPKNCCENCGINPLEVMKKRKDTKHLLAELSNWEERLKQLLLE